MIKFCRMFLCYLVLNAFSVMAWAQPLANIPDKHHPLLVAIDDNYPPYVFRGEDGKLQGYLVDAWALWSDKMQIPVEIEATVWGLALGKINEGKAHVIDTMFRTPLRESVFDFSPPYTKIDVPIFVHRSIEGIVDTQTLRPFTVGVKRGDACADELLRKGVGRFRPHAELLT